MHPEDSGSAGPSSITGRGFLTFSQKRGHFWQKKALFQQIPQIIGSIPTMVTIGFRNWPLSGLRPPELPTGIDSLVASRHQKTESTAQTKPAQNQAIWQLALAPGKQGVQEETAASGSHTA
jgi:hypothetical protein